MSLKRYYICDGDVLDTIIEPELDYSSLGHKIDNQLSQELITKLSNALKKKLIYLNMMIKIL